VYWRPVALQRAAAMAPAANRRIPVAVIEKGSAVAIEEHLSRAGTIREVAGVMEGGWQSAIERGLGIENGGRRAAAIRIMRAVAGIERPAEPLIGRVAMQARLPSAIGTPREPERPVESSGGSRFDPCCGGRPNTIP
jgi:hypothetical protein